jgi:acetyl esterase/lipase
MVLCAAAAVYAQKVDREPGQVPPSPSPAGVQYLETLRQNVPFGTDQFDLQALRAGMGSRREPSITGVLVQHVQVGDIPCEWVQAEGADPDVRLLYLHGGGFVSGTGKFYLPLAAHLSQAARCVVLLPDYRLAPEHKFPAGLEDCLQAYEWLRLNGPAGPSMARAIFIAGDSAGGNLVLATLLALRDRGRPLPAGAVPISPVTDFTLASESLRTVEDPIISAKTMPVFRDDYLDKTDPRDPLVSPVFGDYRGLPPLLIQLGEHEMLRDDSVRAADKARADGIPVTLEIWPGMFHVFQSHEPLLPDARAAISHAAQFMQSLTPRVRFQHHFADRELAGRTWGQTALADLDSDGDLDFITGQTRGTILWYEFQAADTWMRHTLGDDSPSEVGGAAMDVNRDGRLDFVTGGAWYENPPHPRTTKFVRHVFDEKLSQVHDVRLGDIDGDGFQDVITMSDQNDVRWYKVAATPTDNWSFLTIGPSVHSGLSTGDLDGDGDTDVVRSNVWFENQRAGEEWTAHTMTEPWGDKAITWQDNATQTRTADLNGDGRLDVVIADGENRKARIGWLEAPADPRAGKWITHLLPKTDTAARGAYHSLHVADFDNDGHLDIFSAEMELFCGDLPPRWFVWEGIDGRGTFREAVILDARLGGHEAVCGDVDGDGDLDICSKEWQATDANANGGHNHFDFLENRMR